MECVGQWTDEEEDQWTVMRTMRKQGTGSDSKGSAQPITAKKKCEPSGVCYLDFSRESSNVSFYVNSPNCCMLTTSHIVWVEQCVQAGITRAFCVRCLVWGPKLRLWSQTWSLLFFWLTERCAKGTHPL